MRTILLGLAVVLGTLCFAEAVSAQVVVYRRPVVVYRPTPIVVPAPRVAYYAPAPRVAYYAPAPRVAYYAPAPRVAYYAPAPTTAYYPPAQAVVAPQPVFAPAFGPVRRALFGRRVVYYPGYVPAW